LVDFAAPAQGNRDFPRLVSCATFPVPAAFAARGGACRTCRSRQARPRGPEPAHPTAPPRKVAPRRGRTRSIASGRLWRDALRRVRRGCGGTRFVASGRLRGHDKAWPSTAESCALCAAPKRRARPRGRVVTACAEPAAAGKPGPAGRNRHTLPLHAPPLHAPPRGSRLRCSPNQGLLPLSSGVTGPTPAMRPPTGGVDIRGALLELR